MEGAWYRSLEAAWVGSEGGLGKGRPEPSLLQNAQNARWAQRYPATDTSRLEKSRPRAIVPF